MVEPAVAGRSQFGAVLNECRPGAQLAGQGLVPSAFVAASTGKGVRNNRLWASTSSQDRMDTCRWQEQHWAGAALGAVPGCK